MLSKTSRLTAPQRKVREDQHLKIADMKAIAISCMILAGMIYCAIAVLQDSKNSLEWLTGSCRQSRHAFGRPQRCRHCCRAVLASSQAAPDTAVRANNLIRWLKVCCLATTAAYP